MQWRLLPTFIPPFAASTIPVQIKRPCFRKRCWVIRISALYQPVSICIKAEFPILAIPTTHHYDAIRRDLPGYFVAHKRTTIWTIIINRGNNAKSAVHAPICRPLIAPLTMPHGRIVLRVHDLHGEILHSPASTRSFHASIALSFVLKQNSVNRFFANSSSGESILRPCTPSSRQKRGQPTDQPNSNPSTTSCATNAFAPHIGQGFSRLSFVIPTAFQPSFSRLGGMSRVENVCRSHLSSSKNPQQSTQNPRSFHSNHPQVHRNPLRYLCCLLLQ